MANIFNKLFSYRSPLVILSEHAYLCKQGAEELLKELKTYFEGGPTGDFSNFIDTLEDQADGLKLELRKVYERLKWTYFNKLDLIDLIHNLDSVIDTLDDAGKYLCLNKVENIDPEVKKKIIDLAELTVQSVEDMYTVINQLKDVSESAFSKEEIKKEDLIVEKVETEETGTDKLGVEIAKLVFSKKYEMNAVDIMFLNTLTQMLMKVSDRAENVVERVRMILHEE